MLIQIEQNHPDILDRARRQIATVATAPVDQAPTCTYITGGWLMALLYEGLIDQAMFDLLSAERELALCDRLTAPANDPGE